MVRWYTLLAGNVAEHSFLQVVVAAHSLVSLAFLQSDEFSLIRLQRNGIFQQTARLGSLDDPIAEVALGGQ
jgi:hypothetical protein